MKKSILFLITFLCFICFSCKKNKGYEFTGDENIVVHSVVDDHEWYYFTDDNFVKVEKPEFSPEDTKIAWTEAVRISSANNTSPKTGLGYALVNRIGVLTFTQDKITLSKDISLFKDKTAANLIFLSDTPIFSFYKSSYFNKTINDEEYKKNLSEHLFLVQYDNKAKVSFPLLNCNNICDELNAEVVDFDWNGVDWLACVKFLYNDKIQFSYYSFKPISSLLTITPQTAAKKIVVTQIEAQDFRNSKVYKDYKNAPDKIQKLLNGITDLPFNIEVKTAGGPSSRIYTNIVEEENAVIRTTDFTPALNAKAILSQDYSCAIFEDGTLYFEGSLDNSHILRGGKTVSMRLPKLPDGYKYGDFVICGKTLYIAWEETLFYETTRSGFLAVDLNKTLYNKIN